MRCRRTLCVVSAGVAFFATTVLAGDANPVAPNSPATKDEDDDEVVLLSAFEVTASGSVGYAASSTLAGSRLGATPGGFQDVNYGRELLAWGMLPSAVEITAEGLFSEFDLPTPDAERSSRLLSITGDAKAAAILNKPDVTHLAQIGFSSGLDARTWRRDPLFLVVVADVSGSMEASMPLLRASIQTLRAKLGPKDAFALISFSDDAKLEGAPVLLARSDLAHLDRIIDALDTRGGTNIEAGLELGFTIARTQVAGFKGRSRVMLITDAMPNVGATDQDSFMGLAQAASLEGTGLTTIGVGADFDAGFVKELSSVSGGNAFYFADAAQMQKRFNEDLDFMVTELAFDIEIRVESAPGVRLVDVYGLPGDVYTRTPEGGLLMDLATLFLSRERGGIFLSFASDGAASNGPVSLGRASLSYVLHRGSTPERSAFDLVVRSESVAGLGLRRGEMLVNECEALRAASVAFYESGDVPAAKAQAAALIELLGADDDPAMVREHAMLKKVMSFLELAANDPELTPKCLRRRPGASPLVGIWRFDDSDSPAPPPAEFVVFLPGGRAAFVDSFEEPGARIAKWRGRRIAADRTTVCSLALENSELVCEARDESDGELVRWRLERWCPALEATARVVQ